MANIIWHAAPRPALATVVWEWPVATYAGPQNKIAALLLSEEACSERGMNNGPLKPLRVAIMHYNMNNSSNPHRMLAKDRFFPRMEAAMAFVQLYLDQHKEWQPLIV